MEPPVLTVVGRQRLRVPNVCTSQGGAERADPLPFALTNSAGPDSPKAGRRGSWEAVG